MEAECFGGEENVNANAHQQSSSSWKRERTRNAFMLVYDRVMPQQHGEPTAGVKDDTSPIPPASYLPSSPAVSPASSSASPPPPLPPLSVAADNDATDALPRADGGMPVLARRDVDVHHDANVHGQERASGVRGRRRRKRFKAKVPAVFMRQIHQENLEFWRFVCVSCVQI